jgi:hypothetical protein
MLYEGSQAEGRRVALVKTEMEAMSFDERQKLIKDVTGSQNEASSYALWTGVSSRTGQV